MGKVIMIVQKYAWILKTTHDKMKTVNMIK